MPDPAPIYLDTNAYVELREHRSEASDRIFRLFWAEFADSPVIITSELTLAEVLVKPMEDALARNDYTLVNDYQNLIDNKGMLQRVVPVDRAILHQAAHIRAKLRTDHNRVVKLPDAIHLATVIREKCVTFISGDDALLTAAQAIKAEHGRPVRIHSFRDGPALDAIAAEIRRT
ncbi:MAG: type II toxin-antitoxin system VapC family toxin [Labrys sp. (in: a-proteobacteria)]